jgi:hypothetical protein
MKPRKKRDWTPETFPQPRTFPSGWDGSALTSTNGQNRSDEEARPQAADSDSMGWAPEKFPKPRTFPKNWSIDD